MRRLAVSIAADALTGLAALALFVLADNRFHVGADLREGLVVLAALYLGAGALRGRGHPKAAWLKGLVVGSAGSLLLIALGWGSIHHAVLAMLLLTVNLFAVCGVRLRHLWETRSVAGLAAMLLVAAVALAVVDMAAIPPLMTRVATRRTSAPAAFSVSSLDGATLGPADFRGSVVVLDFWATWCPACRREMPELESLHRRYRQNPKVRFWAVDVQKNGDTPAKAREFMHKAGYTLPLAFADEKALEPLALEGFPSLIVIDRLGRTRLVHTGYDGSERLQAELSREIDALLEE